MTNYKRIWTCKNFFSETSQVHDDKRPNKTQSTCTAYLVIHIKPCYFVRQMCKNTMPIIIICKFLTGDTWDTFLVFIKKPKFPSTYHEGIWGTRGIAPSILIFSTTWRWVIIFMPWPLYSWNPLNRKMVGHQSQSRYLCVCQEWHDSPFLHPVA